VNEKLDKIKSDGSIESYPKGLPGGVDPGIMARAFFAGYYNGKPEFVEVHFEHKEQVLLNPTGQHLPLDQGVLQGYGSSTILSMFSKRARALARYLPRSAGQGTMQLSGGIALVKSYFRACRDPEISRLDVPHCGSLSTKIHIATITPDRGFAWLRGYGPIREALSRA
jgi:hypothetical protein